MTGNTDEKCYARASCAGHEMSGMEFAMVLKLFFNAQICILSIKKKFQGCREIHIRHLVSRASLDDLVKMPLLYSNCTIVRRITERDTFP